MRELLFHEIKESVKVKTSQLRHMALIAPESTTPAFLAAINTPVDEILEDCKAMLNELPDAVWKDFGTEYADLRKVIADDAINAAYNMRIRVAKAILNAKA